jgi:hypothetical protein
LKRSKQCLAVVQNVAKIIQIENLQNRLKNNDGKIEALAVLQAQQNLVLTEIKTRLEFLIENKQKRKKSDG